MTFRQMGVTLEERRRALEGERERTGRRLDHADVYSGNDRDSRAISIAG
jgi:hypothetical protein